MSSKSPSIWVSGPPPTKTVKTSWLGMVLRFWNFFGVSLKTSYRPLELLSFEWFSVWIFFRVCLKTPNQLFKLLRWEWYSVWIFSWGHRPMAWGDFDFNIDPGCFACMYRNRNSGINKNSNEDEWIMHNEAHCHYKWDIKAGQKIGILHFWQICTVTFIMYVRVNEKDVFHKKKQFKTARFVKRCCVGKGRTQWKFSDW